MDWTLFSIEWDNATASVGYRLQTPAGQILDESAINTHPSMTVIDELTSEYRRVVRVNEPEAGAWQVMLDDTTGLGSVDMAALVPDPIPAVSIVDVTGGLLREPVEVQVAASWPGSEGTVALFYDTEGDGFDGVLIADGLSVGDGGLIHYRWDTSHLAAGEYYLYARVIDEVNPPVYGYAADSLQITDPVPEVTSLSASPTPVTRPGTLMLNAEVAFDPADDVWQVEFYRGENSDDFLGADTDGSDGWSWNMSASELDLGEQTFFARAQHVSGGWSELASVTVNVLADPSRAVWSTYLGGSETDGYIRHIWGGFPHDGFGVAVDSAGNAFVASTTYSEDFDGAANEHHGGTTDAYMAKVSAVGETLWAQYLGGSGWDGALSVAIDAQGNAVIVGSTSSDGFSGATNDYHGGWEDAFVAKVSSEG
jgi:hypothetical protein